MHVERRREREEVRVDAFRNLIADLADEPETNSVVMVVSAISWRPIFFPRVLISTLKRAPSVLLCIAVSAAERSGDIFATAREFDDIMHRK